MTDTATLLRQHDLSGLAELYELLQNKPELTEMGSRSIHPDFADVCKEIRNFLDTRHGIYQRNQALNSMFEAFGDPSGTFYFGGFSIHSETKERVPISPLTQIETIAQDAAAIPLATRKKFDELCTEFAKVQHAVQNSTEPVEFLSTTKHGTVAYCVPPEVYKPCMSEEELEPFRLSDEEARKKYDWFFD